MVSPVLYVLGLLLHQDSRFIDIVYAIVPRDFLVKTVLDTLAAEHKKPNGVRLWQLEVFATLATGRVVKEKGHAKYRIRFQWSKTMPPTPAVGVWRECLPNETKNTLPVDGKTYFSLRTYLNKILDFDLPCT